MKTINDFTKKILVVFFSMVLFLFAVNKQVQAQNVQVSFQLFYDELSPYGEWIDDPEYGYMWLPDVDRNFQPYGTNGRWVNTQYGNTWYSDYDWGWAPFHYGRWHYDDYYGWAWVPGYEWGPAWVSWRQSSGYYGWAPLRPGINVGVSVNIPLRFWVFVPSRYILSPTIYRYYTPYRNNVRIYNQTTIIHNTYVYNNNRYYSGPDRRSLERSTRQRVNVHQVRNSSRPGRSSIDSRSVALYRPAINKNSSKNARPSRITDAKTVRSRASGNSPQRSSTIERSRQDNTTRQSTQRPTKSTTNRENDRSVRPSRTTRESPKPADTRRSTQPKATNERPTRQVRPSNEGNGRNRSVSPKADRPGRSIRTQETQRSRPTPNRSSNSRSTPQTPLQIHKVGSRDNSSVRPTASRPTARASSSQRNSRATTVQRSGASKVQSRPSRSSSKAQQVHPTSRRSSRSSR